MRASRSAAGKARRASVESFISSTEHRIKLRWGEREKEETGKSGSNAVQRLPRRSIIRNVGARYKGNEKELSCVECIDRKKRMYTGTCKSQRLSGESSPSL